MPYKNPEGMRTGFTHSRKNTRWTEWKCKVAELSSHCVFFKWGIHIAEKGSLHFFCCLFSGWGIHRSSISRSSGMQYVWRASRWRSLYGLRCLRGGTYCVWMTRMIWFRPLRPLLLSKRKKVNRSYWSKSGCPFSEMRSGIKRLKKRLPSPIGSTWRPWRHMLTFPASCRRR